MRCLLAALLAFLPLSANIGPQGFQEFKKRVFVETGCFLGEGIHKALQAGFKEIHSVEIDKRFINHCKNRFKKKRNIHFYLGNSGEILGGVLAQFEEPVTIWLDGHRGSPDPGGGKNTPLLEELEQIGTHFIKSHTILIDDLHCCDTILFDFISLDQIIEKVLEINPNYTIRFVPGGDDGEYPNNVLVAEIID